MFAMSGFPGIMDAGDGCGLGRLIAYGEESEQNMVQEETGPSADLQVSEGEARIIVSYDNLRQLLLDGSLELQQATESYYDNKANYQYLIDTMRSQQEYMRFLADKYEDDEAAAAQYSASATMLGNSAAQMSRRLEGLNRRSNTISIEKTVDSYLMSAQTRMSSYHQMVQNVLAKEKSVAAAQGSLEEMQRRQSVGAATANQVLQAADQLLQQQNLLSSYRQQAEDLRFKLLSMLGISDDGTVEIQPVSQPDLAAIDAIDFESDLGKAIGNDSGVQNARHSSAGTYTEIEQKFKNVAEAEGSVQAAITDTYQQLMAQRQEYQAALDAYESSFLAYQNLQRKQQAGMLSETARLEGEAKFQEAVAAREAAAISLRQAHESYLWEVKGVN